MLNHCVKMSLYLLIKFVNFMRSSRYAPIFAASGWSGEKYRVVKNVHTVFMVYQHAVVQF